MVDNVAITAGTGTDISTDDAGAGGHVQRVKLTYSADGSAVHIPADVDGLLVNLGTNNDVTLASTTVTGTVAVTQSGTWDEVGINDSGNSIMVDWAGTAPPIGAGLEATALRVTLATDSTGVVSIDDNGGIITVDGTVTVGSITAGDNNIGNVDIVTMPNVTNGGTFAVQVDGASLTALQKIDDPVLVDDAAFTPTTSSVMMAGFQVDDTATDSVDEGDAGAARMTLDRRQIVQLGETGAKDVVGGGSKTDTTDQSIMAALASNYNYLCWLTVYNASSTNTYATLKDGATTRAIIPLPAYGGAVLNWPRGLRSSSNTAWNVAAGASVTTAYFYGGGYTATA